MALWSLGEGGEVFEDVTDTPLGAASMWVALVEKDFDQGRRKEAAACMGFDAGLGFFCNVSVWAIEKLDEIGGCQSTQWHFPSAVDTQGFCDDSLSFQEGFGGFLESAEHFFDGCAPGFIPEFFAAAEDTEGVLGDSDREGLAVGREFCRFGPVCGKDME